MTATRYVFTGSNDKSGPAEAVVIEVRDVFPAIQRCEVLETLPATEGRFDVLVETNVTTVDSGGERSFDNTVSVEAELAIEKAEIPPLLAEIPLLRYLPWRTASVKVTQPLAETERYFAEARQDGDVDIYVTADDPSRSLLVVEETALLAAVWKHYAINLHGLQAALEGILYEPQGRRTEWQDVRDVLAKKAFGHDPAHLYGWAIYKKSHYDPDLPSFVAESRDGGPYLIFRTETAQYFSVTQAYYLAALLDLVKAGELGLPLPSNDCAIVFMEDAPDKAEVRLLDTWRYADSPTLPLEPRKEYGKTADQIRELLRYRHEVMALREERRKLLDQAFSVSGRPVGDSSYIRHTPTEEELRRQKELIAEARGLYKKDAEVQEKALTVYCELTRWAGKHKERILAAVREKEKVSQQLVEAKTALKGREFVALPNNMDKLPAHFAAIPSGLESGLHMDTDQFGRAILRVRRQGLQIAGSTQPPQEQIPFSLPLGELKDTEQSLVIAQANKLFGPNGPRWLMPQGIVAVSKLYADNGGYSGSESVVRLHLNDWIDTMRPHQVLRFKEKGRGEAFGKDHKPRDLFHALLGILNRLTYDSGVMPNNPEWSDLHGFYLITANGEDSRGPWTEVMLNPSLHKFITGDGGLPYMICNTQAMFSYDRRSLDYTPAAQMGLEQLARNIMLKTDSATLATGKGDGFTRLSLAQRFGILRGPAEKNRDVLKRLDAVLDNLGEAGVLAEWKVDGRDKTGADAFGVKLLLKMHEDYRKAYNLTRIQSLEKELDKQIVVTPFAEPKRTKAAEPIAGELLKRKRGRPPKQKGSK